LKTLHLSIIALLILVILPLNSVYAQAVTNSVMFMKSNSTAKIYADFTFRVLDNQTWNLNPQIFTSSTDPNSFAKDLIINASPNSLIANKNNVSVVYTITAKSDTKGVYGLFLFFCGMVPIVVGQNESEVNPAILHNFLTGTYNCPEETESTPYMNIVGHSGIISKVITINENNTITVEMKNTTNPNNFYQPPPPTSNSVGINQTMQFPPPPPALQVPVYPSPLEQFRTGTSINDVKCNDGLQLLIKAEDGSPACVKPETAQKLMEREWTREIVTTNSVVVNSSCNGIAVLPANYHAMMFPVLLLQPNSVSCVKLTYTVIRPYGTDENGVSWPRFESNQLQISDLNYEGNTNEFGITQGKDYTNSLNVTAFPKTIDYANYPVGSNFTVTYLIRALPNATGFYDQSIPMPLCDYYPLAVGYAAKEVNSSDFSKGLWNMLNHSCVRGQEHLVAVEVAGMDYTEMKLP
jgi:hypothetical protein